MALVPHAQSTADSTEHALRSPQTAEHGASYMEHSACEVHPFKQLRSSFSRSTKVPRDCASVDTTAPPAVTGSAITTQTQQMT
eukprot:5807720-Pyramimonas_sp.AAC.1